MSTKINDGGAAFPTLEMLDNEGRVVQYAKDTGMTLRDYFAGQCLAGFQEACTDDTPDGKWTFGPTYEDLAKSCYRQADAMLAERLKREKGKV